MSKTITSGTVTFMDVTDNRRLDVYITSNLPNIQIKNANTNAYTPDWASTPLVLEADAYLDSQDVNNKTKFSWYKQGVDGNEVEIATNTKTIMINSNDLDSGQLIVYVCKALYKSSDADTGIEDIEKVTFSQTITGKNGTDGTSVNIKGTATSVTVIPETDYYTVTYEGSDISNAEFNDSYMYNGDLYVCVDSRNGVDYFINVGRIQGPKGEDAKTIILTGNAQVFKISKTNVYTPSTISVTATPVNTTITEWTYSINGGQTFLNTVPTGVVRNGNIVTVTGSTFASNSLVIKASDGQYSDVFTIYKAFDGADGSIGQSASMAFLTNENISFSANANGQVALTTFTTNVVAYNGTTKVTPTIGTITGLPTGMTVATPVTTANEQILTFSIANNSTLGSTSSNNGTITIPITSPVSTNLILSWSKINTGATGTSASLVDITPSALYFKSTMGKGGLFTPEFIYLYPRFQNATYSNWQYSLDGGVTWIAATGANGLTIGTYNSVANTLRVSRISTLYTDEITSISFRCNSTNAAIYDTVSIAKIYDIVDFNVGARNLARLTDGRNWISYRAATLSFSDGTRSTRIKATCTEINEAISSVFGVQQSATARLMKLKSGQEYTLSFLLRGNVSNLNYIYIMNTGSTSNQGIGNVNITGISEENFIKVSKTFTARDVVDASTGSGIMISYQGAIDPSLWFEIEEVQLEAGNIVTDWTPAPEDLLDDASNVNVMLSNESHFFEATAGGVPTESSITLDVVGYKGSIQSATTVGTITGIPSAGMTTTIVSNGTTSTQIKIDITSALTSDIADYGVLTIPITVNGHTINKKFNWTKSKAGDVGSSGSDAVTFQVYSNNGYALSTNTPTVTLQTFAYIGDVEIQAGATYQWYHYIDTDWEAISGATNSYFTVTRDDVLFSNSYMCKMQFNNTEYVGVVTIDDKNDSNKVFTTKPSNYAAGDLWVVGVDYAPSGVEVGTLLRAEHTNSGYEDSDWITSLKYDEKINALAKSIETYNQYFSFDSTDGLQISAKDDNGTPSKFSTSLTNERLSFNYGNESIAYINGTKMNIKEAEIESPLTVTGKYSGSTMLQAPVINIGNFSIIVESNGSLSIVANT